MGKHRIVTTSSKSKGRHAAIAAASLVLASVPFAYNMVDTQGEPSAAAESPLTFTGIPTAGAIAVFGSSTSSSAVEDDDMATAEAVAEGSATESAEPETSTVSGIAALFTPITTSGVVSVLPSRAVSAEPETSAVVEDQTEIVSVPTEVDETKTATPPVVVIESYSTLESVPATSAEPSEEEVHEIDGYSDGTVPVAVTDLEPTPFDMSARVTPEVETQRPYSAGEVTTSAEESTTANRFPVEALAVPAALVGGAIIHNLAQGTPATPSEVAPVATESPAEAPAPEAPVNPQPAAAELPTEAPSLANTGANVGTLLLLASLLAGGGILLLSTSRKKA
ncbi:MAG: hypothetical protein Q3972_09050 [Corynebacterium sp.]|nr:hypothetical protein [Corynebacterium sp.]